MAPFLKTASLALLALLTASATVSATPAPATNVGRRYQSCGGHVVRPKPCPLGYICIDDPRVPGCGMACDRPGICVRSEFCGGIAGIPCPRGKTCYDNPTDDCDPKKGGADCGGICV
ncbi:hypothetical protein PAAG_08109 [Paracoccidioides lutzii Pb01]|uniref:Uncharacterized protein n=1 Tax=Paracoccidioides lutzii (strain ATCC MYA-826 / Pb01) TaxID=502779 RepID=C1HBG8_PARBA|nr:hypothetical protein PAAG_08109 [Paracoccidioides lutzii Pb01]EEH37691.1 hypothetical protein PAAG_08109 [Paracoccidioides lutzii Pb01]